MLDAVDHYFDPMLTPSDLVPWLAGWVGEDASQGWTEADKRGSIRFAAAIHRARGTRNGLKQALELLTGCEVLITENTPGLRLDADAKLGLNTSLQEAMTKWISQPLRSWSIGSSRHTPKSSSARSTSRTPWTSVVSPAFA
jgi:phage tail-like protein